LDSLSTSLPCFSSPAQYPLSLPPRSLLRAQGSGLAAESRWNWKKLIWRGPCRKWVFAFSGLCLPQKKKKNSRAPPPPDFLLSCSSEDEKRENLSFSTLKKKVTSPFFEAEARAFRFTHYFASPLSLAPFPRQSPRAESSDVPSTSRRPPRGDLHPSDVARRACRRERGGAQRPDA